MIDQGLGKLGRVLGEHLLTGLQRGDLILSVNGRSVDDPSQFTRRIRRVDAGETATLELIEAQNSDDELLFR